MTEAAKDTVYIDIDDEITSIIEKVSASKHKIVALVLPKRATVLQSIVNMKLLKRKADEAGKRVVLITSEVGLLPLAGAVGVYTAKTLQSKPLVPAPPEVPQVGDDAVDADVPDADPDLDDSKSIGELAGLPAEKEEETIDVDNDEAVPAAAKKGKDKKPKNKGLKVPDFNSFRTRLFLGIGAFLLLIVLWFLANSVLPTAKITVKADTTTVNVAPSFVADTSLKAVDITSSPPVTPAELKQSPKNDSVQIAATGQKNVGEKAKGTVQIYNCNTSDKLSDTNRTVPAGSAVSSGGLTFILVDDVVVQPSGFNGNSCKSDKPSAAVAVIAQNSGEQYNLGSRSYSVAGFSTMTATGSDMTGGTTQIVKIVSQADIDSGKQQMLDKNRDAAKKDLTDQLTKDNAQPVLETFASGEPVITSTPNVGDQADNVTVKAAIVYTMMGIKKDDLKKLIDAAAKKQIDTGKQPISDYGLDKISFQVNEAKSPNQATITLQVSATAGVKLNIDDVKKQVTGKKKGDIQQIIGTQPGVKSVDVHFSPFWVTKAPKPSKITIVVQQAQ